MDRKIFLTILTFLSFFSQAHSQSTPSVSWSKKMGAVSNPNDMPTLTQKASAVCIPASGGYLIAGTVIAANGDVHGFKGLVDGWIVRLDEEGDTLWTKSYGGSGYDDFHSVIQAQNGDFILGGSSGSTDGDLSGIPSKGASGIWIVRIDSLGNIITQNRFGGSWANGFDPTNSSFKQPTKLIERKNGDIAVISTYSGSGLDVNAVFTGNPYTTDIWLFQVSPSLDNIRWQKGIGGSGNDVPRGFKATADGGFIIAAYTNTSNGDVPPLKGDADYWVIKTDSTGTVQWQKTYGGILTDNVKDILVTSDKGYLIAGQSNSVDGDVQNPLAGGTIDIWLIKTDSLGNYSWDKGIGSNAPPGSEATSAVDDVYTLIEDIDGNYIIAGEVKGGNGSYSGTPASIYNGNYYGIDGWLVKLSKDGNTVLWEKNYGGDNFDWIFDIQQKQNGSYIFCGSSLSSTHDLIAATGSGGHSTGSLWITKLNACPYYTYETVTICKGSSYQFGGHPYNSAGTYRNTLQMVSGCDSIVLLTLIVDSIEIPVIAANGNTLSTGIYSSYQWLDETKNPIGGATGQAYEAPATGNYYVAVTGSNGCTDTSSVYSHTATAGINEPDLFSMLKIYPNPATEEIYIEIPQVTENTTAIIYNAEGKMIRTESIVKSIQLLEIRTLKKGIYFITITSGEGYITKKIIKE